MRILLLLTCTFIAGFTTQSSAQEQINFLTLQKPVKGYLRSGPAYIYRKTAPQEPGRVEMFDCEDGIVIRTDFRMHKFDHNLKKLWEAEVKREFNIMDLPYMRLVSDKYATYLFDLKAVPDWANKIRLVRISAVGEAKEYQLESDLNANVSFLSYSRNITIEPFVLDGDLKVLVKIPDHKQDKLVYKLYSFNSKTEKLTSQVVDLPADNYEYKECRKNTTSVNPIYLWQFAGIHNGNAVLNKSYLKKIDGEKYREAVIQIAEVTKEGEVKNVKTIDFQPVFAGDDRKFSPPSIKLNSAQNAFYASGLMAIGTTKINALYLLKYDYTTATLVYKHEHSFKDILKPEIDPKLKAHYNIPGSIDAAFGPSFEDADMLVDKNGFIDLRIITNVDFNSAAYFETKFDQYGKHIQTSFVDYKQLLGNLRNVIPHPQFYQLIWRDITKEHPKPSPWDFINSQSSNTKDDIYWIVSTHGANNKVIKFNQDKGTFDAFIIE